MSIEQAIVLAIVQGLTEFMPVSSSGHLVLGSWLFDWPDQGVVYDAAVHLGTLAAVLVYFRREWVSLVKGCITGDPVIFSGGEPDRSEIDARRLLSLIVIATIPVVVIGFLFKDTVEDSLRRPETVGFLLLVTAAVLTAGELLGKRRRRIPEMQRKDGLFVGIAQAAAVLPGISRSGVTIAAGLAGDMTRDAAARFAFLLAIPAIGGAGFYLLIDAATNGTTGGASWGAIALGTVISFIVGLGAIALFMRMLRVGSLNPFIIYCSGAGVAVLVARAMGA